MLKVAESEEKFGRHGDIKPENILWFSEIEGVLEGGILQIADMGLGRFHRLDSRSRVDPRSISGSPTYSPPEIAMGLDVSRAYDIWSLGCVFLEFVTWLLGGGNSIYAFASARELTISPGMSDDTFYTVHTDDDGKRHAEVRQRVKTWLDRLRQNQRFSRMISSLLDLVQSRMLVIDSGKRVRADEQVMELKKILDRAQQDEVYLLSTFRPSPPKCGSMMNATQDTLHPLSTTGQLPYHGSLKIDADQFPSANGQTVVSPSIYIEKC
jgi:serine/threonine protein kinase